MLSDKGLKLRRGGASTVGGVFPPEVVAILEPVCVRVLLHTWVLFSLERPGANGAG